jgi:hypothetical protein
MYLVQGPQSGTPRRFRYRFTNPLMQSYVILRGVAEEFVPREGLAGTG